MKILNKGFHISTRGGTDILDITGEVEKIAAESRLKEGSALIFISGSTAAITTVEYESGLLSDLRDAFERIAPSNLEYAHNRRWQDGNGRAHVLAALMGPSLLVPIKSGRLHLGTWQQIVLLDFDNRPREREVSVQIIGE